MKQLSFITLLLTFVLFSTVHCVDSNVPYEGNLSSKSNTNTSSTSTFPDSGSNTSSNQGSNPAKQTPPVPPASVPGLLRPNQSLTANQSVTSANRVYTFVYQADGNAVLYGPQGAIWSSATNGTAPGVLVMQTDGNLVVYNASGKALWASGTNGNAGAYFLVGDDGSLSIYSADGRRIKDIFGITNSGGMNSGTVFSQGQGVRSADGRYILIYQADGNAVMYGPQGVHWSSGTYGTAPRILAMQTDGNLVIYNASGTAIWSSGTAGNPGAGLAVQNDGNLVIYSAAGRPIWALFGITDSTWMNSGKTFSANQGVRSADGRYLLIYQTDGNAVMYGPQGAIWSSATAGTAPGVFAMQTDGNLVVYNSAGKALWSSGTAGNPGARLAVQTDGNLVIYTAAGRAIWALWGVAFTQ